MLTYEPANELMLEYRQVLQRAMKQQEDDDDDEEEEDDDDDEAGVVVCSGCGERGHAQDECPHRSDISDDEAISDDDGEDFS